MWGGNVAIEDIAKGLKELREIRLTKVWTMD